MRGVVHVFVIFERFLAGVKTRIDSLKNRLFPSAFRACCVLAMTVRNSDTHTVNYLELSEVQVVIFAHSVKVVFTELMPNAINVIEAGHRSSQLFTRICRQKLNY